MSRSIVALVAVTAAASSVVTVTTSALINPPAADAGADSSTLRSVDRHLGNIERAIGRTGEFGGSGVAGEVSKLRADQSRFCRAIAERTFDCP